MLFQTHCPGAPLCDFVEDLWLYEDYAGPHRRERILPTGTVELVFNLQEDALRIYGPGDPAQCRRFAGAVVSGPYAGAFMSDAEEETALLGVHFRPGGASAVLGLPVDHLANAHVDLATLLGPAAARLREQLCTLRAPRERFRLVEQALAARLADSPRGHGAVRAGLRLLMRSRGQARVRDVARAVDLSQRRFIQLFAAEVGLTPKLFGRIQRFQHAVARSRTEAAVDWAELAVACGYYDQAHMIGEFAEFAGASPSAFLRQLLRLAEAGVHVKRHHLPVA